MKLIITIENNDVRKLRCIEAWLSDMFDEWDEDNEKPLKGTSWDSKYTEE